MNKLLLILAFIQWMLPIPAFAQQDAKAEITVDLDVKTAYVWRGLLVVDDPVFQPAVTLGYAGLTASVWMNVDLTDINQYPEGTAELKATEVDYTLDYTFQKDWVSISGGVIHYAFPNTGFDSTTELYAGISFDSIVSLNATLFRDVDQADGAYLSFSASTGQEFTGMFSSWGLSCSLGYGDGTYNEFYWGTNKDAITDLLITGSATVRLASTVSLVPHAGWSVVIDDDFREQVEKPDVFIAGATLTFVF